MKKTERYEKSIYREFKILTDIFDTSGVRIVPKSVIDIFMIRNGFLKNHEYTLNDVVSACGGKIKIKPVYPFIKFKFAVELVGEKK